jgi:hypothetical protein
MSAAAALDLMAPALNQTEEITLQNLFELAAGVLGA